MKAEIGKVLRELCNWKAITIIEAKLCLDHICFGFRLMITRKRVMESSDESVKLEHTYDRLKKMSKNYPEKVVELRAKQKLKRIFRQT